MESITFGVLTISDRCSRRESIDESGPNLVRLITGGDLVSGGCVTATEIVPDDTARIQDTLRRWCDEEKLDVVLTTGGTGLARTDITPEATKSMLDKEVPGISALIFKASSEITPLAALSRGTCGIRGKTLILNLPGSKKGAEECARAVAGIIKHAVDLARGDCFAVRRTHGEVGMRRSKVDAKDLVGRNRQSTFKMYSVEDAQKIMETVLRDAEDDLRRIRNVSLKNALGYVLAEDVFATTPLPPFPASIKDGYAVVSEDPTELKKVLGCSTAGDSDLGSAVVRPGFCVRISTGACVPGGADSVVQVEDTELVTAEDGEEAVVKFRKSAAPGENIRQIGSDIRAGERILVKSTLLGACEMGVLATAGISAVKVYVKPRVGVLSTGNELVEPEAVLPKGKIRDSNRTSLIALLRENGFDPVDLGIAQDEPDELARRLAFAFDNLDVVVTSGSVSMGEKDFLKRVLQTDFNAVIHFGRVNMKPGKPMSFASLKHGGTTKLWFGLPGNPVSAVVTSSLFVFPALRLVSGCLKPYPTRIRVRLMNDMKLDRERPEYARAVLSYEDDGGQGALSVPIACTTGNQISSRLTSCVGACCLLELPVSSESMPTMPKGSIVNALLIRIP